LPRFFAGLVDDEQREQIYAIQASYQDQIEALEKELATLKEAELSEMEKVLTAAQRKELETLRSESEKPSAEKSSAAKSDADADSTKAKAASTKKNSKSEPAKKE
jgi:TolA-binding protein